MENFSSENPVDVLDVFMTAPPELLSEICSYLSRWDLYALTLTSKHLGKIATAELYKKIIVEPADWCSMIERENYFLLSNQGPQNHSSSNRPDTTPKLRSGQGRRSIYEELWRVLIDKGFAKFIKDLTIHPCGKKEATMGRAGSLHDGDERASCEASAVMNLLRKTQSIKTLQLPYKWLPIDTQLNNLSTLHVDLDDKPLPINPYQRGLQLKNLKSLVVRGIWEESATFRARNMEAVYMISMACWLVCQVPQISHLGFRISVNRDIWLDKYEKVIPKAWVPFVKQLATSLMMPNLSRLDAYSDRLSYERLRFPKLSAKAREERSFVFQEIFTGLINRHISQLKYVKWEGTMPRHNNQAFFDDGWPQTQHPQEGVVSIPIIPFPNVEEFHFKIVPADFDNDSVHQKWVGAVFKSPTQALKILHLQIDAEINGDTDFIEWLRSELHQLKYLTSLSIDCGRLVEKVPDPTDDRFQRYRYRKFDTQRSFEFLFGTETEDQLHGIFPPNLETFNIWFNNALGPAEEVNMRNFANLFHQMPTLGSLNVHFKDQQTRERTCQGILIRRRPSGHPGSTTLGKKLAVYRLHRSGMNCQHSCLQRYWEVLLDVRKDWGGQDGDLWAMSEDELERAMWLHDYKGTRSLPGGLETCFETTLRRVDYERKIVVNCRGDPASDSSIRV